MTKKKPKHRQLAVKIICFILWALFTVLMLVNAGKISDTYSGVSLRYNNPISAESAFSARRLAAEKSNETPYWPLYWSQSTERLQSGYREIESPCIWYSGEGGPPYPANFIYGGWTGSLAEDAAYVSTAFAWNLWGGTDVMGLELAINGKSYRVAGVLDENNIIAIINCGDSTPARGWQAIELGGSLPLNREEAARDFSVASGLGAPDTLLNGFFVKSLSLLCAVIPSIILLLFFAAGLFLHLKSKEGGGKIVVLFAIAMVFAIFLPLMLEQLPQSVIPGKWSDFSHWGRLIKDWAKMGKQLLIVRPYFVDYKLKTLLIAQVFTAVLAVINSVLAGVVVIYSVRTAKTVNRKTLGFNRKIQSL